MRYVDQDEASKAQQESADKSAKEHVNRAAIAPKAWDALAAALRADVDYYNGHPKTTLDKRIELRVMQHPQLIELYWRGKTFPLLHVEPKTGDSGMFSYSLRSATRQGLEHRSGAIAPSGENEFTVTGDCRHSHVDAAKVSEELLSPVLFP